MSLTTAGYVGIPPDRNNEASAIINLSRNLGGSIGVAAATTELAWRIQFHHERLGEQVSTIGARGQQLTQHGLAAAQQLVNAQAQVLSYLDIFYVFGIAGAVRHADRVLPQDAPRRERPMDTDLPRARPRPRDALRARSRSRPRRCWAAA